MGLPKIRFLLDENVPIKLKRLFEKLGLTCQTIQELGWCGLKDREIAERLKAAQIVFVTRDKDFTFIWKHKHLKVIYIAIEPAILEVIEPRIENILQNWNYVVECSFLLIIQNESIRYWREDEEPF